MFIQNSTNGFSLRAWQGDAKTLLAFDLPVSRKTRLAGFTIACTPNGKARYYIYNKLQFKTPADHAQNRTEPAYSTINAPIQMFRWLHVPGSFHQEQDVFYGKYTYTVTPRYFDKDNKMVVIDNSLSVSLDIDVVPFSKNNVELGFTRGFVQSQAFTHHFGQKAKFKPAKASLQFDTSQEAGKNSDGESYTYLQEYQWSGFTAREKIFKIIGEVQNDKTLSLDVFAYDFNEPDIVTAFLQLAKEGQIRMILDNATLHHTTSGTLPEDKFQQAFEAVAKMPAAIIRGKFKRFQHNKLLIVKKGTAAVRVLGGSTNFSVTGIYVNSNHVVVYNDAKVAQTYADVFDTAWEGKANQEAFLKSPFSSKAYTFKGYGSPDMIINFSPHKDEYSQSLLQKMADRITSEKSSVLFAVMDTDPTVKGPISTALIALHKNPSVFSYGISDSTNNIFLYKPSAKTGVKVTGKAGATLLPKPFDKEASIGIGHQVHHKFVVCGFNTPAAVAWFGSSNLAQGGEDENGDNLIEVHDQDIATVFALEAVALVDHFLFRDKFSTKKTTATELKPLLLGENDGWTKKYFTAGDLYYKDRLLFR